MAPNVQKIFLYVLPPLGGLFMSFWPGALQLTFFIQAMITLTQSYTLRQPWVREYLGIQPLPNKANSKPANQVYTGVINRHKGPEAAPEGKPGFIGGAVADIQKAKAGLMNSIQKNINERQQRAASSGRRTEGEMKHAKAYDLRRKREIAQERFERQQEADAKLADRQERDRERKAKRR